MRKDCEQRTSMQPVATRGVCAAALIALVGLLSVAFSARLRAGGSAAPGEAVPAPRPAISQNILPVETKGYLSIPDLDRLREDFGKTQLGRLLEDPLMKPFFTDLEKQINERLAATNRRLGLTWKDVETVYAGEICIASIQPPARVPSQQSRSHAMAMIVDVRGKAAELKQVEDKIRRTMADRRALRKVIQHEGVDVVIYKLRRERGELRSRYAIHFHHKDHFVAVDHEKTALEMLSRLNGNPVGATLGSVKAFREVFTRVQPEVGKQPQHVRFFIEPLGFAEVSRASQRGKKRRRGTDRIEVLRKEGFDKISGVGGILTFNQGDLDATYYAFAYAPQAELQSSRSVKMLKFPNSDDLIPAAWTPLDSASLVVFNWKMQHAFSAAETLINGMAGDEIWQDVLRSLKTDQDGPMVDVPNDLIKHVAERALMITDVTRPITPTSERILFVARLLDDEAEKAVRDTVRRAFQNDPGATRVPDPEGKHDIWELTNDKGKKVIAVTVAHGSLIVGSHLSVVQKAIRSPSKSQLAAAADYKEVMKQLEKLGADSDSFRIFSRTRDTYEVNFELLRQNKMPQSRTMIGRMLNQMFSTGDDAVEREQRIDGGQLPPFEKISKYFRPGGAFIRSEEKGWLLKGGLLR